MKEKIGNFTFCLFCFTSIYLIFKNNQAVAEIIISAVNLFLTKVFVSLFPMFIINDILISLNIPYYFYFLFNRLFLKLFHVNGLASYVFIMSLISGTPSNAYILKELVNNNQISSKEASHYLMFTYFSNPLFLITMLSSIFSLKIAIKIIIIHYISNLMIAFITRKKAPDITENKLTKEKHKTSSILIKSINKTMSTLLMILGTVTFYMMITYLVSIPLKGNPFFTTLISGILEITNGLNRLANLDILIKTKEILAIAIISFGGLSIHTQIKAILEDTKIEYKYFFKGRIFHTLIATFLIILF